MSFLSLDQLKQRYLKASCFLILNIKQLNLQQLEYTLNDDFLFLIHLNFDLQFLYLVIENHHFKNVFFLSYPKDRIET